jgi:hypothetical protein
MTPFVFHMHVNNNIRERPVFLSRYITGKYVNQRQEREREEKRATHKHFFQI